MEESISTFKVEINGKKYEAKGVKATVLGGLIVFVPFLIFGYGLFSIAKAFY